MHRISWPGGGAWVEGSGDPYQLGPHNGNGGGNGGGFNGLPPLPGILPPPTAASLIIPPPPDFLTIPGGGAGFGAAGAAGCNLITNQRLKAACLALVTGLAGKETQAAGNIGDCPAGQIKVRGLCIAPGDWFPGGAPFMTGAGGSATMGAFGMPAITPGTRQTSTLRCPRRYVLGMDNLCYPKGMVPRNLRKWAPDPRPLLSAMDGKILNRAKSVQRKLRRVAGKHVPRPKQCKPRRKK